MFCQVKDGKLAICVEDDGNGFTGKMLERGMEPFLREETDDSASPDATDPAGHLGWGSISAVFSVKNAAAALSLKIGNGAVRRQRILK